MESEFVESETTFLTFGRMRSKLQKKVFHINTGYKF